MRHLVNEYLLRGVHTIRWDGKNDDGDSLSSGVYFYQLRTKNFNKTMKMLLVK